MDCDIDTIILNNRKTYPNQTISTLMETNTSK